MVILTAVTMVVEIIAGWLTGSMALLADGIHMGSHVLAIGLSWAAYVLVQRLSSNPSFTGNKEKVLTLSGLYQRPHTPDICRDDHCRRRGKVHQSACH